MDEPKTVAAIGVHGIGNQTLRRTDLLANLSSTPFGAHYGPFTEKACDMPIL